MNKHVIALIALALATGAATTVSAQDIYGTPPDGSAQPDDTPFTDGEAVSVDNLAYSQRGIVLPSGTLRADASFSVMRPPNDMGTASPTGTFLSLGAAYGVMDNLEVGVSGYRQGSLSTGVTTGALPFQLTKDFNLAEIAPYARYRFFQSDGLQVAGELTTFLPTGSDSNFGVMFGAPVRLMLAQMIAIDTGVFMQTTFADSTINDLVVPLSLVVNVMPELFLLARTQFIYSDFDTTVVSADLGGGYTIEGADGEPMLDLMATFGFPTLLRDSDASTDIWQANVTAAFRLGI
ncbi:MAG: hypothetical protein GXP55_23985 [Deltaproteobacteria bacterium]|nr:hypothetical protein [Deltaproteobacteria bacterium]